MYHDNPSVYLFIKRIAAQERTGKTREEVEKWIEETYPLNPPLSMMGKEIFSFSWRPKKIRKVAMRAIEHVYDGVPVPPQKKTRGGELKRLREEIEMLKNEQEKVRLTEERDALIKELSVKKNEKRVVAPDTKPAGRAGKKT